MRSVLVAALSLTLASLCSSQVVQYVIDPDTVAISDRRKWCDNQKAQCPLICAQLPGNSVDASVNDCDPETLQYRCVCKNGVEPNSTEYTQTIPYYQCQTWQNQCVDACGRNNVCANDCRAGHPCGAQSPTPANSTTASASTSATKTASSSATSSPNYGSLGGETGSPGAGGSFNKPNAASSLTAFGQSYGLAVVFGGIFAGFTLLL